MRHRSSGAYETLRSSGCWGYPPNELCVTTHTMWKFMSGLVLKLTWSLCECPSTKSSKNGRSVSHSGGSCLWEGHRCSHWLHITWRHKWALVEEHVLLIKINKFMHVVYFTHSLRNPRQWKSSQATVFSKLDGCMYLWLGGSSLPWNFPMYCNSFLAEMSRVH